MIAHNQSLETLVNRASVRIIQLSESVAALQVAICIVYLSTGVVAGSQCALWASNKRRSVWMWFMFGLFLPMVACPSILWKHMNTEECVNRRSNRSTDQNDETSEG